MFEIMSINKKNRLVREETKQSSTDQGFFL